MLVDMHTSAAQLKAAARWAQEGDGMAEVMLAVDAEGYLTAGQGDERAVIGETGELIEGECGIEPLSVPEALTLNNTDQDALILAAEAILAELAGRIEETDPDGRVFHEAMDAWDWWRRQATTLARAAGKTPDDPEPVGRERTPANVIAGPGHWYALQGGELVALPMSADDDPADLPAHPDTLSDDEAFRAGWYGVDFATAFDETNPEDLGLVDELREIERRLAEAGTAAAIEATQLMPDPEAVDDDGVPIFSDETRAAAQADPRGERDR
jgi:hypothetical protein